MEDKPHVICVVPFSRPHKVENVLSNFESQSYPNKSLLVVQNGKGIGAAVPGATILTAAPPSQSVAKNEGIAHVQKNGGGYIAIMDDDDYYSPDYLNEAMDLAPHYALVGKVIHFVATLDGFYLMHSKFDNHVSKFVQGATHVFHSDNAETYPIQKTQEDDVFCGLLRQKNKPIYASSRYNFCYMRTDRDHLYNLDMVFFNRLHKRMGDNIRRIGKDFDKEYVDGIKKL